ncbi:hypothetical protein LR48_Vigan561s005300 [Vigna angularis]|uniref:Uncharacterized protein n=1 Tax=Phaseolus angularis TaxID=3914 RepID=A0A0L9TDR5_PHAAN|nr:hypothetical protein LR48_Vigan561s005300 [Vigna angularis]
MVLLLHLPRFPLYLITSSQSLPLRALSTSSKTTLLRPPKATLTTSEPVTVTNPSATELSLEKLFVPPETNVSLDTARVLNGSNILLSNYWPLQCRKILPPQLSRAPQEARLNFQETCSVECLRYRRLGLSVLEG